MAMAASRALGLALLVTTPRSSSAADNGQALLPPMGWRSWNCYAADIDQPKIQK